MGTILAKDVIGRVEAVTQDEGTRWPRQELQSWLNEAYLAIALARPDSNSRTGEFACAAGTRQKIDDAAPRDAADPSAAPRGFPTALRLLDVTRNLPAGRAIRLVRRSDLDDERRDWHSEPETGAVRHYAFDPRLPKEFFVYPPAKAGTLLEAVYTEAPGRHDLSDDELDPAGAGAAAILLDDIYAAPLADWILYRAYSKDAEHVAGMERAAAARASFADALGIKNAADAAADPGSAE